VSYILPPQASSIESPLVRKTGANVLSLALIDARNHTLSLAAEFERLAPDLLGNLSSAQLRKECVPALWLLGHVGWFQEHWIGRNTQRHLGARCPQQSARLASIEPLADSCFDPRLSTAAQRWTLAYPDVASVRSYLLETLETTLELLGNAEPTDEGLYFYRLALAHEDQLGEQWIVMAQTCGLPLRTPLQNTFAPRAPLLVPATRWSLGAAPGGFSFDNEGPQHEVSVPEFEIDAQPVSWAQFVEFVDDGGYDSLAHWSEAGRAWLSNSLSDAGESRRAPRYVEQIGVASGAVMQMRFGRMQRMASNSSVMHMSWYEAQAYAAWAGRRLATEVEWEIAASRLAKQGFRWGDVWEWTANTFRHYPNFVAGLVPHGVLSPCHEGSAVQYEHCKTLRGASWATRERMKVPSFRGFALPERDDGFFGCRTCAL
jgi:gamma-glutamyl hercynylcysteine S-oxide synthase